MKMFKRKSIIALLSVIVLGVGGTSLFLYTSKQLIQAETTNEEREKKDFDKEIKSEERKAREKLEKLSDEEILELIDKFDKANKGGEKLNDEDAQIIRTLTSDEYYNLTGMTDDEVLNWIDIYHGIINSNIMLAHQEGGVDSEGYEEYRETITGLKGEFKWIRDNYNFEKEYHNDLMKEIVDLIDAHVDGDNDALFSLKYILYELNEEFNPESFDEERATHLTLSNAVRIQNGQDPINEHE